METETLEIYKISEFNLQIGILIHEMTHAFIDQYECRKRCCKPLMDSALGGSGLGKGSAGGHGPTWADRVVHLSTILNQHVAWVVDRINIIDGIRLAMCDERYQPSNEQLERWGLNTDFWGKIDHWEIVLEDYSSK